MVMHPVSRMGLPSRIADSLVACLQGLVEEIVAEYIDRHGHVAANHGHRELISRREAARMLGVRTSRVNDLIRDGELVLLPEGVHGKLSRRNVNSFLERISQRGCYQGLGSGSSRSPRHG